MTDAELRVYYSDLLILQYKGKPRAQATVEALVDTVIGGQLPLKIQDAFDIETATGGQLDVLGKYAGVTRDGYSFSGPMVLNDDDYRKIIKLQVIKNSSDSSLYSIQELLYQYFEGLIRVFDYRDMSMGYYVNAAFGSQQLVEFFINKGLLPAPMAVGLASTIYYPDLNFYSFRTYQGPAVNGYPMNTYDNYNETWPWLTYAYAINSSVPLEQFIVTEDGVSRLVTEAGDRLIA